MNTELIDAWHRCELPVVTGRRPTDTWSLADLASPHVSQQIAETHRALGATRQAAGLAPLHLAAWCAVEIFIAPLVVGRLSVGVPSDQLGVRLDRDGSLAGLWVGRPHDVHSDDNPFVVGLSMRSVVSPVLCQALGSAKIGTRVGNTIAEDALLSGVRRWGRAFPGSAEQIERVLDGIGIARPEPCLVIDRPEGRVRLPVNRVCCVVAPRPTEHSCPTCPLYRDPGAMRARVDEWLSTLPDSDYAEVTGLIRRSEKGSLPVG